MSGSLDGVLPELAVAYNGLTAALEQQGIRSSVADYGGVRTESDTTKILQFRLDDYNADVAAGNISPSLTLQEYRPIAEWQHSFHDYGAAFDLAVKPPAGMTVDHALQLAGGLAPRFGLRWGGTFHNADADHFELAIPLADARARWAFMHGAADAGDASAFDLFDPSSLEPEDELPAGGNLAAAADSQRNRTLLLAGAALLVTAAAVAFSRR